MNVSAMELTQNSRRPFPYLLPSDILGIPLNIPSSMALSNPPPTPTVSRLATPLPPIVQPGGHTCLGNQYLSREHYNNSLYVPYP